MLPFTAVSVFKETPGTHLHVRTPIMVGVIFVLVILLSALFYYTRTPPPSEPRAPATAPPAAAAPPREEPSAATRPVAPPSAPRDAPRRATREPAATVEPVPPAAPTRGSLTVESDVAGASVFLDRQFVGTTPVTLNDLEPGAKRVNLSADGFDGVSRQVEVTPGANTVTIRFKEVRLDQRMPIVHKHGVGSCEGTLAATVDGFRFDTSNAGDRFTLPFAEVEEFRVDYLEKNLRLKQLKGRTWNFTTKTGDADALFVFHRDVEAARQKLAKGYTAVR
jgi:hypothetical protein